LSYIYIYIYISPLYLHSVNTGCFTFSLSLRLPFVQCRTEIEILECLKFFGLTRGKMSYEGMDMWGKDTSKRVALESMIWVQYLDPMCMYSHAPHNDVSINDKPHIRRWSHNIIISTVVLLLPTVFSTVTCCTGL